MLVVEYLPVVPEKMSAALLSLPLQPLQGHIPHGFGFTVLDPGHEFPVKFEVRSAGFLQKSAYVLRFSVAGCHWGCGADGGAMPVKTDDLALEARV